MNRATLVELQHQRSYPSITLLLNTTPGHTLSPEQRDAANRLIRVTDERLRQDDVSFTEREHLLRCLEELVDEQADKPATRALAVFVSPDYVATVRLGRHVKERVTIDDTFTTRDLVADLNRTARYRVITVSERKCRVFLGDRQRLVEQRDDQWPMLRDDDQTAPQWSRMLDQLLRDEQAAFPLPTVVAGVRRSVRTIVPSLEPIGFVPGNHDRTSAAELHHVAWPIVSDWLRTDGARAMERLDRARSTNRYAGGIQEIWPLAKEGRIDTVVVEEGFALSARVGEYDEVVPAADPDHPEVNDDIVDDTIEVVLRNGGSAVIVDDGALDGHGRIAAVLRY